MRKIKKSTKNIQKQVESNSESSVLEQQLFHILID